MKYLFFNHDGKLGDAVVHTILTKGINQEDPNHIIDVTVSDYSETFWNLDDRIRNTYVVNKPGWFKVLNLGLSLRKNEYDYLIIYHRYKSEKIKVFIKLINPKKTIFIESLDSKHISIRENAILQKIFHKKFNLRYSLPNLDNFNSQKKYNCLINLFAGINESKRTIKSFSALKLIFRLFNEFPDHHIVLVCEDQNLQVCENIKKIVDQKYKNHLFIENCGKSGIKGLIGLCGAVEIVISPDTALIHIASALNKAIIGIFQNDAIKPVVWAPLSDKHEIILGKHVDNIHDFSIRQIVTAYKEFSIDA